MSVFENYDKKPFSPFVWNEYQLTDAQNKETQSGKKLMELTFETSDGNHEHNEALFYNPETDELYKPAERTLAKISAAFNPDATIKDAMEKALESKQTIWLRFVMDGKYMQLNDVQKQEPENKNQQVQPTNETEGSEDTPELPF